MHQASNVIYSRPALSESDDSSLNSVDLDAAVYVDSDTGLESMSSAETPHKACSLCSENGEAGGRQTEALRQEVTRLKCDKLDLLRQNVVSQLILLECLMVSCGCHKMCPKVLDKEVSLR